MSLAAHIAGSVPATCFPNLRGFEIAVRRARPWAVMCAYNRLNGVYCSENDWLLNQVLRERWGFDGLVVTDWGAANDRVRGVRAGLDLEMSGSGGINDRRVARAVGAGELAEADLDRCLARNVSLSLLGRTSPSENPPSTSLNTMLSHSGLQPFPACC